MDYIRINGTRNRARNVNRDHGSTEVTENTEIFIFYIFGDFREFRVSVILEPLKHLSLLFFRIASQLDVQVDGLE